MRRLLVLALLLCALPVGAQDWIRYYPPAGVSGITSSGTTITSTLPILLPDGSTTAPALSFASETDLGFYRAASGRLSLSDNTAERIQFTATRIGILSNSGQFQLGANLDVILTRDAADTLQAGVDLATATAQTIKGPDSTGDTIAGASLTLKGGAGTSGIANGGALILAGGDKSSTGEPGAVAISDGGTKPTCAAGIRGSIWYDAGGAGVADTFEVCAKQAAGDSYAWRALATIP